MVNNRFRSADYLPCQLFNFGMIATGNHNFERFAALCNTPGEAKRCKPLACTLYYSPMGKLLPFNERLSCVHFGRLVAAPTGAVGVGSGGSPRCAA